LAVSECGDTEHLRADCVKQFNDAKCNSCGKSGHIKEVCLETIRAKKMKAEKVNIVSPHAKELDNKDIPAGDEEMGRNSPQPVRREVSRVTHFSHRIEAAEGPQGKATLMFCNTEKEEEVASCSCEE
jgi:hypothetical protein